MREDAEVIVEQSWPERVRELRERVARAVRSLDLRARIASHPWQAAGIAAALGAWVAYSPPSAVRVSDDRSKLRARLADALLAGVGSIAVRLAREAAFRHVSRTAQRWWADTANAKPDDAAMRH